MSGEHGVTDVRADEAAAGAAPTEPIPAPARPGARDERPAARRTAEADGATPRGGAAERPTTAAGMTADRILPDGAGPDDSRPGDGRPGGGRPDASGSPGNRTPAGGNGPANSFTKAPDAEHDGHSTVDGGTGRDTGTGSHTGTGNESADGVRRVVGRRGAVDPVKTLMHRHRDLCERAVDPLEIAAGLEAHGVTDRTAARFRHRDVFSLAEEMYARVPRDAEAATPDARPSATVGALGSWAVLALVPGALGAAVVTGLRLTEGQPRLAVAATGALTLALGLRPALRRGPLSSGHGTTGGALAWTGWLVAYTLLGDGLLRAALGDGPDGNRPLATAPFLALTLSCAPAAWCAHLFVGRARRRLATSRGLEEFAASVRPLLLGAVGLFGCALLGLLALCGAILGEPPGYAGACALGVLLLLARLLTARGSGHVAALVLAGAGTAEAAALTTAIAARLPGCAFLATPVDSLVGAWGAGAVPALACGAGAAVLLLHATRALTRASAHAPTGEAP